MESKSLIASLFVVLSLVGCATTTPPPRVVDQTDPIVRALRSAPEIRVAPELDLSEYRNNISFEIRETEQGEKEFVLDYPEFQLLTELLKVSANRIKIQRTELREVKEFYDEHLGRQTVGGSDQDPSSKVPLETR